MSDTAEESVFERLVKLEKYLDGFAKNEGGRERATYTAAATTVHIGREIIAAIDRLTATASGE